MATKDWEKVDWETSQGYPTWRNKNKNGHLMIRKSITGGYVIESENSIMHSTIPIKYRSADTKFQALSFARKYMRSH